MRVVMIGLVRLLVLARTKKSLMFGAKIYSWLRFKRIVCPKLGELKGLEYYNSNY